MTRTVDLNLLDTIVKETITHIENGKDQISTIAESSRREKEIVHNDLIKAKAETLSTIEQVDKLEIEEKKARLHLMKVSRDFNHYTEDDVKEAYKTASDIQLKLGLLQERERQLRIRRDQLELSLRRLTNMVEKAEDLVSKVGAALSFLASNMKGLGEKIEEIYQKQQLGLRIIKAQEEERRRVARDIHDGPAQSMANVVMRVEICEKLMDRDPDEARKELADLKDVVKQSLQDVRKIIFGLRPMVLDDLGLVPALKRYFAESEEKSDIIIDFSPQGNFQERLNGTQEIAVFRIIQEALHNAQKHGRATMVAVSLEQLPTSIRLMVKDNGCGFDVTEIMAGINTDSYGLLGMRERIDLLDGTFDILSSPGSGTEITVQLPINLQLGIN